MVVRKRNRETKFLCVGSLSKRSYIDGNSPVHYLNNLFFLGSLRADMYIRETMSEEVSYCGSHLWPMQNRDKTIAHFF